MLSHLLSYQVALANFGKAKNVHTHTHIYITNIIFIKERTFLVTEGLYAHTIKVIQIT